MKGRPIRSRLRTAWRALRGESPRARQSSFQAAEVHRLLLDWATSGLHVDDSLRGGLCRMRDRARDLEHNSPVARHFLRMVGVNVIGPSGFQCRPMVRGRNGELLADVNSMLRDAWQDWCEEVTIDGKLDFDSLQRLALKSAVRDGEVPVRLWRGFRDNPYGFALEAVDPVLLDETYDVAGEGAQNEVRLGVEVNQYGRPLAYHVWNRPPRLYNYAGRERVRIPADQMLHIYEHETAGQTRGLPGMVSVMVTIKGLEGYREAELVAARIGAAKMAFFQRREGLDTAATLAPDDKGELEIEANPGTFLVLPDGYEVADWNPDHPPTAYGAYIKDKMREIATGLGVSYNALASDLEGVNYSSMRSGLLIERDVWRLVQKWWVKSFIRPIYREWLRSAVIQGAATGGDEGIVLPSADAESYMACAWAPRGWPWVDPLKDVQAAVIAIQAGLTSRQRALAEQGVEFVSVLEDLAAEADLAAQYGVDVSGPPSGGQSADSTGSADPDDEAAPNRNGGETTENRLAGLAAARQAGARRRAR